MKEMKGMTFVGMLFTMAAVILLGLLALRIAPVYLQHFSIIRALHALESQPQEEHGDLMANEIAVRRALMRQFEIDSIDHITDKNIIIKPVNNDKLLVTIQYQVTRPFIGNIDLLFTFNNSQEVTLGRE